MDKGTDNKQTRSMKPHAMIFGANEVVWWDNVIEAIAWSILYNVWHRLRRDGKCITTIHYKNESICV